MLSHNSVASEEAVQRSIQPIVAQLVRDGKRYILPDSTESPIEYMFALASAALMRLRYPEFSLHAYPYESIMELRDIARLEGDRTIALGSDEQYRLGRLFPQVNVGQYRLDFVLLHREGIDGVTPVGIECDGHEFHDKTKEQAQYDKERDRCLQQHGVKVLRFTGSEIFKDPCRCADQVLSNAFRIAWTSRSAQNYQISGHDDLAAEALSEIEWGHELRSEKSVNEVYDERGMKR